MVARSDVVFVNMNYRLSTLGFLALNDGETNGNFGIADLIAALDWTRAHIADFGGDPNHITIAGQSAGAAAVRALLGSPKAIGKFAGAIEMSNLAGINFAATYSNYFTIGQEVTKFANPIIQAVGCSGQSDVLACLRQVDANTLVKLPTVARSVSAIYRRFHILTSLPASSSMMAPSLLWRNSLYRVGHKSRTSTI